METVRLYRDTNHIISYHISPISWYLSSVVICRHNANSSWLRQPWESTCDTLSNLVHMLQPFRGEQPKRSTKRIPRCMIALITSNPKPFRNIIYFLIGRQIALPEGLLRAGLEQVASRGPMSMPMHYSIGYSFSHM